MKSKIENDPDLKKQKKILDHHPHASMPQHGHIRKAKAFHLKYVDEPRRKHGR